MKIILLIPVIIILVSCSSKPKDPIDLEAYWNEQDERIVLQTRLYKSLDSLRLVHMKEDTVKTK